MKPRFEVGELAIIEKACLRDVRGKCICAKFGDWQYEQKTRPVIVLANDFDGNKIIKVLFRGRVVGIIKGWIRKARGVETWD